MKKKLILSTIFWLLLPFFAAQAVELYNPLSVKTIPEFINQFIKGLLGVVGAFALYFLVNGGLTWMMSGGNPEKVKAGKESIKWAIFGLAMIFFSYSVISIVISALKGTP